MQWTENTLSQCILRLGYNLACRDCSFYNNCDKKDNDRFKRKYINLYNKKEKDNK